MNQDLQLTGTGGFGDILFIETSVKPLLYPYIVGLGQFLQLSFETEFTVLYNLDTVILDKLTRAILYFFMVRGGEFLTNTFIKRGCWRVPLEVLRIFVGMCNSVLYLTVYFFSGEVLKNTNQGPEYSY